MSIWPRSSFAPFVSEPSFTPLFRLLDEFDNYSGNRAAANSNSSTSLKAFQPKFDVKEVENAYELHGELPGIDQKDVEIEFVDQQTLNIRGRTERHYEKGTRPSGFIEGGAKSQGAITDGTNNSHKATVEDEGAENKTSSTAVTAQSKDQQQQQQQQQQKDESKYWVSERSVGEFSRTFSFPARIDQDAVKASMKNGILSIVVPKAKKAESRKITIS